MTRKSRASLSPASHSHAIYAGSYIQKQMMRRSLATSFELEETISLSQSGLAMLAMAIILCAVYSWRKKNAKNVIQNDFWERRIPLCAIHSWGRGKPSYSTLCRRVKLYSLTSSSNLDVKSHVAGHLTQSTWISTKNISEQSYFSGHGTNISQLLLLLSGDVESNPGPPTTNNNDHLLSSSAAPPTSSHLQVYLVGLVSSLNLSFIQKVLPSLLLLSGDVELNPGPETPTFWPVVTELIVLDHKWKSIGIQLGIPMFLIRKIETEQRNITECLYYVVDYWLRDNTNTPVTWESMVEILDSIEEHALAEKLRRQYLTTQAAKTENETSVELDEKEKKAMFDEAMEQGHIDVSIIKILIVGAGGVGKTSLLKFLCGLDAPDTYNSTGCIDTAQRLKCERVRTSKDDSSDEIKWELVTSEKLNAVLADAIKSRAAILTTDDKMDVYSQEADHSVEESLSSVAPLESVVNVKGLLGYKGGELFSITWIYLVDSGGQPQFHELLTTFVKNATLGIFVFNLSESLDAKPEIKYYKNGEPCDKSYQFPLSHKEIFQHCVQTILSLSSTSTPHSDSPFPSSASNPVPTVETKRPKILVVGTHREKEIGSRDEKEKSLEDVLKDYGGEIITNEGKYIFPVDSILRSPSDVNVVDNIRKGIFKCVEQKKKEQQKKEDQKKEGQKKEKEEETKLPLQYYALELELEVLAKKGGCDVISFETCFNEIGSSLKFFDRRKFLRAIQYLDELNLILYFESHAPDVIFTNPNTLLDKVGEIIEKSYIWREKIPSIEAQWVSNDYIALIKQGEVTIEVLKSFESSYVEGLFDHTTFAGILTHLFVLVPISEDKYFMPALLEVNEDLTSPTSDYFAVSFPNNAPMGLFSSSVVCLLSKNKPWKKVIDPDHLFRNSLTFNVGLAKVTLLDKRSHFEVHITKLDEAFKKNLPKMRFDIHEDVINAIEKVKNARKFRDLEYSSNCFCCPRSGTSPHLAKYEYSEVAGDFVLECTKGCIPSPVKEWHKQWLGISAPSSENKGANRHCYKEPEPTLALLTYTNGFQLMERAASQWHIVAANLRLDNIENIRSEYRTNTEKAEKVFTKWLNNAPKLNEGKYPKTWQGLEDLLNESGLSQVAKEFFSALEKA